MLEFNTYEEQDLDSDPVIFLECGHFYSRTTLDGIMEIGEFSLKIAEIHTLQLSNLICSCAFFGQIKATISTKRGILSD